MRYLVILGLLLAFLIFGYDIRVIVVAGGFNYRILLTTAVILFGIALLDLYRGRR
jgi:hypothetical protein